VRDDVVELAGDPLTLPGNGTLGRVALLLLEAPRAFRELTGVGAATVEDESDRSRHPDEGRDPEVVLDGAVEVPVRPHSERLRPSSPASASRFSSYPGAWACTTSAKRRACVLERLPTDVDHDGHRSQHDKWREKRSIAREGERDPGEDGSSDERQRRYLERRAVSTTMNVASATVVR
jgi:hypothetical protein